jgi:ABC-type dipeptide/oligopeptide/nickel transport system permease component
VSRYLVGRLLQAAVVLVGISTVVFFILRLTGDPVFLMVMPGATTEQIEQLRHAFGFDRPLLVQYVEFLARAARGDFGLSIRHQEPALGLVLERVPATLQLAAASLGLAAVVAVVAGVLAAVGRGTWLDALVTSGALLGQSVPSFWLGIMLIMVFSVRLRWLPSFGLGTMAHLVLPAVTLSAFSLARLTRLVRSGMLEVLGQDYIRTARAKGLRERLVVSKHGLRNALLPVVTLVGLDAGFLLGGAIIVETIFAWPGMGQLALQAVYNRDFPLVQANVIFMASLFVAINLAVDLVYMVVDPKIRYHAT